MPEGPCVVCGARNYLLSMGGPMICPACDVGGSFEQLRRQIRQLEKENQRLRTLVLEQRDILA